MEINVELKVDEDNTQWSNADNAASYETQPLDVFREFEKTSNIQDAKDIDAIGYTKTSTGQDKVLYVFRNRIPRSSRGMIC